MPLLGLFTSRLDERVYVNGWFVPYWCKEDNRKRMILSPTVNCKPSYFDRLVVGIRLPRYTDLEAGRYEALWIQQLQDRHDIGYSLKFVYIWPPKSIIWMEDARWETTFYDQIADLELHFMITEELFIILSDMNSAHLWSKGLLRIPKSTLQNFPLYYSQMGHDNGTDIEFEQGVISVIISAADDRGEAYEKQLNAVLSLRRQHRALV